MILSKSLASAPSWTSRKLRRSDGNRIPRASSNLKISASGHGAYFCHKQRGMSRRREKIARRPDPLDAKRTSSCGKRLGGGGPGGIGSKVLILELLAPTLDFRVVENLADHAAEQALEVRAIHVTQRADAFLLVALEQGAAAFVGVEFEVECFDLRGCRGGEP